jgi:hypothetical protein
MTIEYIHFDSFNQTYSTSNQNSTYTITTGSASAGPNSFNCEFTLPQPKHWIKKIHLRSVEIPLGFPNIRASSNLNTISLATTYSGGVYSNFYNITLPDKTYTDINVLITDINALFLSLYPSVNIIFSLNSTSGFIQINSSTSATFTSYIYIVQTNLSYVLGFRPAINTLSTRQTIAGASYQLNFDNYINMYIANVQAATTNANNTLCHFKIPLNAVSNVIYYNSESSSFAQYINITSTAVIQKLTIVIYDRFGYSLHSGNLDWSFSLGFEQ